jgi:nucleotide-binding universal stress UspA family protein
MKVLIPVDGSQAALAAVDHVCTLKDQGADIEAVVLHVAPRFNRHTGRFVGRNARAAFYMDECKAAAAGAVNRLAAAHVPFQLMMTMGPVAERIARVADRQRVDQIVMGTGRQPEWLRRLVGSVSDGVMARTDIPVTVLQRGRVGVLERYGIPAGAFGLATWWIIAE